MASKKITKAAVAVDPVDVVPKPKIQRAAGGQKAGVAPELTTTHQVPAESDWRTWVEAGQELKTISRMFDAPAADKAYGDRIQARSERRVEGLGLSVGSDRRMADYDVADFQQISEESGLRRFAAVTIADNMDKYPDYKTFVSQLDAQHPGLLKSIDDFNKVNNAMVAAKETRKSADLHSMTVGNTAHGVSVNAVDGGFEVSFPFDRQLAAMIDRVQLIGGRQDQPLHWLGKRARAHRRPIVIAETHATRHQIIGSVQIILV